MYQNLAYLPRGPFVTVCFDTGSYCIAQGGHVFLASSNPLALDS